MRRVLPVLVWAAASCVLADAPAKPNVIFILADDLSYRDLGCFGQTNFATPHIDRLAAGGRIFANAYAGGPWCAPSRTALLTGRHAGHGAPLERDAAGRATKFNPTVAEMLKTAGYATCVLGKWHMLEPHDTWNRRATWGEQKLGTNAQQMPWHRGFDVCRIGARAGDNFYFPNQIESGDNEEIMFPEHANVDDAYVRRYSRPDGGRHYDAQGRFVDKAGQDSSQLHYSEEYYRAEAAAFLQANKDRPFFLYYATPLVHGPLVANSLGEFKDKAAPWTLTHKLWAAMVRELDRSVGFLMDEVRRLGLEKNTIILFASDNGYAAWGYFGRKPWADDPLFHNKGPWNRGKFITTNGGLIVPFIAWGPGRVPPGKTERAINFYDFMATAGELAGATLPGPTDGVSFVPLLEGRDGDQPLRDAMVWPASSCLGAQRMTDDWAPSARKPMIAAPDAALLDEKWYALGMRETGKQVATAIRLFDISADPGMKNDRSADQPALCARASSVFAALRAPRTAE
jgi:arylsulfatase A-like enzyme